MPEGVVLAKLPACGLVNVRLSTGAAPPAVVRAIGLTLPETPCSYTAAADVAAYWLAPGEWLVAVNAGAEEQLEDRVRSALGGVGAVVDVSAGYARYDLRGPAGVDLLMKASPYDFDRRTFGPGRCVQTVFAKITALVAGGEDASFELVIRRSYADYFERWTTDAASAPGG